MNPRSVATAFTLDFVTRCAPRKSTILEVGCGEGDLADELIGTGYHVLACEADAAAAAVALRRGVTVCEGQWPDVQVGSVDVVLFTRSLHHIHELASAIRRAREVLNPGGLVLVEDFDFANADRETIHWFSRKLRSIDARVSLRHEPGEFATDVLEAEHAEVAWRSSMNHSLHSASELHHALGRELYIESEAAVPYLFRYLIGVCPATAGGIELVRRFLADEVSAAAKGEIRLIGRRFVARA